MTRPRTTSSGLRWARGARAGRPRRCLSTGARSPPGEVARSSWSAPRHAEQYGWPTRPVESDLASVGVTMHQRRAILEARREKRGATFAVEFVSVKESVMGERPPLNALGAILPKPASHKATEPSK